MNAAAASNARRFALELGEVCWTLFVWACVLGGGGAFGTFIAFWMIFGWGALTG